MSAAGAAARIEARVAGTGLLPQAAPVVVLLSGGRDSVCLLDLAVRLSGPRAVSALHVNYGLRDTATDDEEFCSGLCASLAVPLEVRRPRRPEGRGNLQAWARDQRHAAAAQIALSRRARVATGHTSTDQVETLLYRLAASPGRRALLGMRERDGRLVRPLLGLSRDDTAAYNRARGLAWRDDPTNDSDAFARNRVRHGLLEALKTIHPAAEANLLATLAVLRDESDVLESVVDSALTAAGHDARGAGADVAGLRALAPALRRLAVQKLADEAQGGRAPAVGRRTDEILQLAAHGGSGSLDLGGGVRAVVEYGRLRFTVGEAAAPESTELAIPGSAAFGAGELSSERGHDLAGGDPDRTATLDADALAPVLQVRAWRAGDRMRPLGLGGSKRLQDLFGDRRVPRARRATVPVVVSAGEIAWIPGVATSERFKVTAQTRDRVRLAWRP